MSSKKKAQQSESTQRRLIAAARTLFAERGYVAVATEEVVQLAKVTRGALYHHYSSKEQLFEVVVEEVIRDVHLALAAELVASRDDLWRALEQSVHRFLELSQRDDVQRIVFRDAPSVMGWSRWRALDLKYGLGAIQQLLSAAMAAGIIIEQPPGPVSHLLLGALIEAAMVIAHAEDRARTRDMLETALKRLLAGLRATP